MRTAGWFLGWSLAGTLSSGAGKVRSVLIASAVTAALLARPTAAADPATAPRVGAIVPETIAAHWQTGLRDALVGLGYAPGRTIIIEWRKFDGSVEQAKPLAQQLLRTRVDLIFAATTPATRAAMESTSTVPVVFVTGDPVSMGFAESLSRPGKNGTGISMLAIELTAKRLELLKQLLPGAQRIGYLRNPSNPLGARMFEAARKAAEALSVQLEAIDARSASRIDAALDVLRRRRPDALVVSEDLLFAGETAQAKIVLAARNAGLPAIYPWPYYHAHRALMSYGVGRRQLYQTAAAYIDRILKGARPAELPVEQLSKYELIIDMRVAKSLNIEVPQSILLRADEVIR